MTDVLVQIDDATRCSEQSNAIIGERTRHIIEIFLCLTNEYKSGIVNYDKRERNKIIETDSSFAIEQIEINFNTIDKPSKYFLSQLNGVDEKVVIHTNYYRELVYNLEHCIHHQFL